MPKRKPSRKPQSRAIKTQPPGPAGQPVASAARPPGNVLVFGLIIGACLLAFANAWPNNLVYDDRLFADFNRFAGLGAADLLRFFSEDLWDANGEDSSLYRPLLMLLVAGESLVFKDWMAGYHLVSIGLHVIATLLVYGFIRRVLERCEFTPADAVRYALLAALVFAVHPVHCEVVNSIFNSSEILVTLGVMGGLSWLLDRQELQPFRAWLGLNGIFLLLLFCRESAAALPLLAVAVTWLVHPGNWRQRLRACAPAVSLGIPLAIYLVLRSHALGADAGPEVTPESEPGATVGALADYGMAFGLDRIMPAVGFWADSLQLLVWPHPLQIHYDPPQPGAWLELAVQLAILAVAAFAWLRGQPLYLIGLALFYLAILPSSRIIGEPDVTAIVSDRFLYLPSVGLVLIFAAAMRQLAQATRFSAAAVTTTAIVLVFTPLSLARNADWADDIRLFESDYRKIAKKELVLPTLLAAHLREGSLERAVQLCDDNRQVVLAGRATSAHCGSVYGRAGRFRDAEQAYSSVITPAARVFAQFNLGMMYLHLGRRAEAEKRFEVAIATESKPFMKLYFEAVALIQLHPTDRTRLLQAQALLRQALELQPQHVESRLELEQLQPILERLD